MAGTDNWPMEFYPPLVHNLVNLKEHLMFEMQYNDEMEAEVRRLEGKKRATAAGHPEWDNACARCGCELSPDAEVCGPCRQE